MIETGMGGLKCPTIVPHEELYIYNIGWDNPNGEWTHDILTFCGQTGINLFGTDSIVLSANLAISEYGCRPYIPASPFVTVVLVHIHSDGSLRYGDSADGEINDFLSIGDPIVDKR